jgi:hypothetical protein
MELDDIQKIYVKICSGYEKIIIDGRDCFLKHHDYLDRHILKQKYNDGILIAQKNGIKTESDYLNFYIERGWWSKSKEHEIRVASSFIESLKKSKERLILPSQKEKVAETIMEEEGGIKLNQNAKRKGNIKKNKK